VSRMIPPPVNWIPRLGRALRVLGPYGVIELVAPGGSLIVLSLWAFRHRSWLVERARRTFGRRPPAPGLQSNPEPPVA
jgi:hypothetical protein